MKKIKVINRLDLFKIVVQRGNFFTVLLSLLFSLNLIAQKADKKELENKKKNLQIEIEYTNQLLSETKNSKKISLNQLVTINKKISSREQLINTIYAEINVLNKQIADNNASIKSLQAELEKLKKEYAKMIYYAYKNRSAYDRLMFVFSAQDFNQAFMRLKYMQQYSEYMNRHAASIKIKQDEINLKIKELELSKEEKKGLLGEQENEKLQLSKEKQEKEQVFAQLQDKEKELKKELDKKKKDAKKLQEAIQKIIAEELAASRAKNKGASKSDKLVLTPEATALSNSFSSNRGRLPWPLIKGVITSKFGIHPHPLMPDVEINNSGIDISTSKGTIARSVFEGEVTGVAVIPGAGKAVIIRHGEFLSVYSNLNEVFVKNGDKIKTKQNIGTILYDDEESKTELHIEIWKGQTKLDPEDWLYPISQ